MSLINKRKLTEVQKLDEAVKKGDVNKFSYNESMDEFIISFNGPQETNYNTAEYCIKFKLPKEYPFKQANGYFIGTSPQHPFYEFDTDTDDTKRSKRTTNLANTDFGIMYEKNIPMHFLIDYVELIKHSLTPKGTEKMKGSMMRSQ